jgi:hypothetical protein
MPCEYELPGNEVIVERGGGSLIHETLFFVGSLANRSKFPENRKHGTRAAAPQHLSKGEAGASFPE